MIGYEEGVAANRRALVESEARCEVAEQMVHMQVSPFHLLP